MSRPEFGNDGDVRLARGLNPLEKDKQGQPSESPEKRRSREEKEQNVCEAIEEFVRDDMGYLKVRRGLDADEVHLTWTFANGAHYGHYVYVKVFYWQLDYGLELLIQKRDEVYGGTRLPTPDKRMSRDP